MRMPHHHPKPQSQFFLCQNQSPDISFFDHSTKQGYGFRLYVAMNEYKRKPNTVCAICSKPVYRRPSQIKRNKGRVFCSLTCRGISERKETPCVVCGSPIMAHFNKKTCSRSCANINRTGITYTGRAPKDKVKSQRALKLRLLAARGKICERCGYDRHEILQVHHKNRDRNNNELDNLELICPNCHCIEHYDKN